jgi:rhodanese-related sulfurtransferase
MVGLLGRALALLLVGSGVGLVLNGVRSDGVAMRAFAPPASCAAPTGAQPRVEVLPPGEAVRLCGDPGVLIADVRPPARFAEGHVAQAIHLPCAAPSTDAESAVSRLAGKHTLIVYGDSTAEARPVAEDLRRRLLRPDLRVVVLDGGFPAWNKAGLACSSGPCPECAEKK